MPTGLGSEAVLGGPAMPVRIRLRDARGGRGGEQETDAGLPFAAADAERPVLVVARKAGRPGASLADDVQVFAVPQVVHLEPGLDRDLIAAAEIEGAFGPHIG